MLAFEKATATTLPITILSFLSPFSSSPPLSTAISPSSSPLFPTTTTTTTTILSILTTSPSSLPFPPTIINSDIFIPLPISYQYSPSSPSPSSITIPPPHFSSLAAKAAALSSTECGVPPQWTMAVRRHHSHTSCGDVGQTPGDDTAAQHRQVGVDG